MNVKNDQFVGIRPTISEDIEAIKSIVVAAELFQEQDTAVIEEMLRGFCDGELQNNYWITYADNEPVAVAYYAPEILTEGTWNLLMIAVHPDKHGQGIGTALMNYVEQALAAQGERILLVDTSGSDSFERTRAFYAKCGYDLEARIRDYYAEGDDKVTFRKSLQLSHSS